MPGGFLIDDEENGEGNGVPENDAPVCNSCFVPETGVLD
jgi:hypothetical protein